jgi:hypothetical protein
MPRAVRAGLSGFRRGGVLAGFGVVASFGKQTCTDGPADRGQLDMAVGELALKVRGFTHAVEAGVMVMRNSIVQVPLL